MTRGFALYMFNAQNRAAHRAGHSGIDCTVPDLYDELLGDTHSTHSDFYRHWQEYRQVVTVPVIESPVCPNCGNVHPVYVGIPDRVMGATLIRGATIVECGLCGHRIGYKPRA